MLTETDNKYDKENSFHISITLHLSIPRCQGAI